jgi:hypothetical protein
MLPLNKFNPKGNICQPVCFLLNPALVRRDLRVAV